MIFSELYESIEDLTIVISTLNEEQAIKSVIKDLQTQGFEKL